MARKSYQKGRIEQRPRKNGLYMCSAIACVKAERGVNELRSLLTIEGIRARLKPGVP